MLVFLQLKACQICASSNMMCKLKHDPSQFYPIEIFALSGYNTMHIINYMHTEYLQCYQTTHFLYKKTLELFFQSYKLALDLSLYLHPATTFHCLTELKDSHRGTSKSLTFKHCKVLSLT